MNSAETWKSTIGSIVRFLLGGVAFKLAEKGVVTQSQAEFLIMEAIAATLSVLTVVWAYVKNRTHIKEIVIALRSSDVNTSVADVKRIAKEV